MNLTFDTNIAEKYTSQSQKVRVLTEHWVQREIYCPNCGNPKVEKYANNKPVADFYCAKCTEDFELKAGKGKIKNTVTAGAYSTMIERINSTTNPNFFFLAYLKSLSVDDFFVVPKHFFTPDLIKIRKPLTKSAQRANHVMSNILFSGIPKAGHIFYIENGIEIPKDEVLKKWKKTVFLKAITKTTAKGWILDIMNCIDSLNKKEFSLQDMYNFENDLAVLHPENKNIKPKIRQQLQFLRDKNYLTFTGRGTYQQN
ncbi:MAG: DpnI domain-containing protein [Candidatus Paceibacterota bacterium]|jgi:type II restriction enzyme